MDALLYRTARTPAACERRTTMRYGASSRHMGEPRPAAGVEPGLLAAGLAMALLLRLLSGIRIMTAISQAAAATFFILLMPADVCRLIARIRGWDPDPDPTERN